MAADFSQLLSVPLDSIKKPPILPAGDYPGIIKQYELGDANKNKTPYIRFNLVPTDWAVTTEDTWLDSEGASHSKSDVDLSKRQFRRDYFLTQDALWRLTDLMKGCGLELAGKQIQDVLPELIGCQVLIEIQQYLSEKSGEFGNQVGKVVGV
jgi:hypothetical protein